MRRGISHYGLQLSGILVVVLIVLTGCASAPAATTSTPTPTPAPAPITAPAPTTTTPVYTPTPAASLSPTPTPITTLPPTPAPTTAPTPTPTPTPSYTINTASQSGIGNYLVDAKGMTLYYFARDVIGKSNATGPVLQAWPIFYSANFIVPSSMNAADFSNITRDDGQKQTTYKGWPLYYYAKDKVSGDTSGEGVGGIWFVLKVPFYSVMLQSKAEPGNYLVDAKGMTLYWTTKDAVGP